MVIPANNSTGCKSGVPEGKKGTFAKDQPGIFPPIVTPFEPLGQAAFPFVIGAVTLHSGGYGLTWRTVVARHGWIEDQSPTKHFERTGCWHRM